MLRRARLYMVSGETDVNHKLTFQSSTIVLESLGGFGGIGEPLPKGSHRILFDR